jgi:hypothetical protein
MSRLLLFFLILMIILTACSGKDKITVDNIPPIPPILIPHLGDLGDPPPYPVYNGQTIIPDDENNGIDAVPDGDWIKVSWEHFLDTDLDYVKIYRFDDNPNDIVHEVTLVDSIGSDNEYYIDSRSDLSTNVRYSYYIEVLDNSGNSAFSDTVSYALISKQLLISPSNGAYQTPNNITFEWQRSGDLSIIRVLVFGEDHEYLWSSDIDVSFEDDVMTLNMPTNWQQSLGYTGDYIYWRVDAFEWDNELQIYVGSESNERILYLVTK